MDRPNAASTETTPASPRSLASTIGYLARVRRQFGNRALAQWLVDRAARRLMHFQVDNLVCFDVDRLPEPPAIDPALTIRFLKPDEIRGFAADPANEIEPSMADRAAAGRELCLGVLAADCLAGYGWCAFGSIDPRHCGGLAMSCPPHVAYMFKGFTRPEFRGMRLNGLRVLVAAKQLAPRGIRQLVALVDWTNWSSMRSSVDAGCTVLGQLVTIGLARRRWSFFPDVAQSAGIKFGPRDRQRAVRREVCPRSSLAPIADYTHV